MVDSNEQKQEVALASGVGGSDAVPATFILPPAGPAAELARPRLPLHIRWMIRRDLYEVLDIETSSFEFPWSEKDFLQIMRGRNCVARVVDSRETETLNQVAGYMVYELHKHHIELVNMAVAPNFRRRGVGTAMLAELRKKLTPMRRRKLQVDVRESNLNCQLWLRANGMRAVSVLRKHFDETDESAYRFVAYSNQDELCHGS